MKKNKERLKKYIHIAENRTQRKENNVETDACYCNFIGVENDTWSLHGYIDQATEKVLSIYFDE